MSTRRVLSPKLATPLIPAPSFLTPAFCFSSLFSSLFTNKIPLSLCFSATLFHSCLTLFTLKEISLLFATLTKTTPGYTPELENSFQSGHPTQRNLKMERASHSTTELLATESRNPEIDSLPICTHIFNKARHCRQ